MPNDENDLTGAPVFEKLRRGLKQVTIDGETYYVAEGDLLLDASQLANYALQRASAVEEENGRDRLIASTRSGKVVRWEQGLTLTYCVLRNTFASEDHYKKVRDNVQQATWAWQETCGVMFEHKAELDASVDFVTPGVLFTVRQADAGGRFIAAAFFPDDPDNRRKVLIDPSYFTTDFDRVGVLRHELGHVLGFRHEHIRSNAPPICRGEDTGDTLDLTQYDPQSVMHYFCGGVGSRTLEISQADRVGSQRVYGPPLDFVTFVR